MANDDFAKLAERVAALESENTDLRKHIDSLIGRINETDRVNGVAVIAGDEVPIRHFNADRRFFKWERNGAHLTLLYNEDANQGGPGLPPGLFPICDGGDVTQIGEPGEGAEAPDEDAYLHDGLNGCAVYVMTRVLYDHTVSGSGGPILYGYQRPIIFDINGRLCQVGIEERYIIDEPEPCDSGS